MGQQKVAARHLARSAYLYVRRSTTRQVVGKIESTERQYALRQRAVALGWPADSVIVIVIVIDSDLGQSGASRDREGFRSDVGDATEHAPAVARDPHDGVTEHVRAVGEVRRCDARRLDAKPRS